MASIDFDGEFILGYKKAPEVKAYFDVFVEQFEEEFSFLAEVDVLFLFAEEEIVIQGKSKSGFVILPSAMGQNRKLYIWALSVVAGYTPEVVMVILHSEWQEIDSLSRAILVYHEMCHLRQKTTSKGMPCFNEDGAPVVEIVGHDVEEHFAVAEKFGLGSRERMLITLAEDEALKADSDALLDRLMERLVK